MKRFKRWLNDWAWNFRTVWSCLKGNSGRLSGSTYAKYPPDCEFLGARVLNLGCGKTVYKAPNVINLDLSNEFADVVWDLSKTPLPFKDQEFDHIIANHVLEHIPDWWECFKELARVVKIGGIIEVWGPGPGDTQLGYRDHINVINGCSFSGTRGSHRNTGNAWFDKDIAANGYVKDLEMIRNDVHTIRAIWLALAPTFLKKIIVNHCRNVVYELGFLFRRLPPEEKTNA
jgi:SAM-dependent methyltransferase